MKNQTTTETNTIATELIVADRLGVDMSAFIPELKVTEDRTQIRAYSKLLSEYKPNQLQGLPKMFKVLGIYIAKYIQKDKDMNAANDKNPGTNPGYAFDEVRLIKDLVMKERDRVFEEIKKSSVNK